MARRMLINAQRPEEVRVAIVDGETLDEYQVAVTRAGTTRGNVYRGVVTSVHPGLNAAFVDYGAEKDGLLAAHDVVPQAYHRPATEGARHARIDRILERGKTVLVQVTKDPSGSKGAALTTKISLAGRYLVLMPYGSAQGISHRVEDEEERRRIREVLEKVSLPEGFGFIVRTAALNQNKTALNRDLNALLRLWKRIRAEWGQGRGPLLLYSDQDLIIQAVRDWLDNRVEEVLVDSDLAYEKVRAAMRAFMPRSKVRVTLYQDRLPLFSRFRLQKQIESIFSPKVELPSGGSIVIEGTEALTAIDVNSGRSKRGGSEEENAYQTNLEAAPEVARQLKLRDIGGLIVVDFIDMRSSKHRKAVEKAMRDAMKSDRARVTVGRISPNGLLEINRQRLKTPLMQRTHRLCPTCGGAGRIPSAETVALNLMRRIEERAALGEIGGVVIRLHPELADSFQNRYRHELAALEDQWEIGIEIVAAAGLHRSEQEMEWRPRRRSEQTMEPKAPAVDLVELAASDQRPKEVTGIPSGSNDEGATSGGEQASKSTSRKRRRSRRKKKDSPAVEEAAAETATPTPPSTPEGEPVNPPSEAAESAEEDSSPPTRKKRRRRRRRPRRTSTASDGTGGNGGSGDTPAD